MTSGDGERIGRRLSVGMSRRELAEYLGLATQASIQHYEYGYRGLAAEHDARLMDLQLAVEDAVHHPSMSVEGLPEPSRRVVEARREARRARRRSRRDGK